MAVLMGDPSQEAEFAYRLRLPDGFLSPPHIHPVDEHVTVLSGTLLVGWGEGLDEASMTVFPAGSYLHIPAGRAASMKASGATSVQVHGTGPFRTIPVGEGAGGG